jgi:hypothetical protein
MIEHQVFMEAGPVDGGKRQIRLLTVTEHDRTAKCRFSLRLARLPLDWKFQAGIMFTVEH